ncbi:MAG: MATE family efflux transporter [Burkholderiaceae bacterium]|nr:MATE family efflux transporter [Burkholderiaceae bacterium]
MRADILRLAWPVFIGQLAIMANGIIDTVMAGQMSARDLAAVGLGSSIYISVYVSLMGVLLALTPIAAHHFGAGRLTQIGASFWQAIWVALALSAPGCLALAWSTPWLMLAAAPPELAAQVDAYLQATAFGVPAALLFRCFYAMNTAISRPKVVMTINLLGVAAKFPLNHLFMHGSDSLGLPALGGAGCGVASSVIAWVSVCVGGLWLWHDRGYRPFALRHPIAPRIREMGELLRLGVPIGASYLVEVTSFTFMAIFVARFGTVAMASHQITSNLTGVVYMIALALANATSTLAAQAIGAGDPLRARAVSLTGLRIAMLLAGLTGVLIWLLRAPIAASYSNDPSVIAATLPLLGALALFLVFDSLQTQIGYILRAYKIATLPMVVCVLSMWGVGLGGGYLLTVSSDPAGALGALHGSRTGALGFWVAGVASLALASAGLALVLRRTWRR